MEEDQGHVKFFFFFQFLLFQKKVRILRKKTSELKTKECVPNPLPQYRDFHFVKSLNIMQHLVTFLKNLFCFLVFTRLQACLDLVSTQTRPPSGPPSMRKLRSASVVSILRTCFLFLITNWRLQLTQPAGRSGLQVIVLSSLTIIIICSAE